MEGPYGQSARLYFAAGWANPIPVRGKRIPPSGYTGYDGRSVTHPDIERWTLGQEGGWNAGVRMAGTVGIDVDAYDGEIGNLTLERAQAVLGELPPTWSSTSRGPGQSRILIYKLPVGCSDLRRELEYAEKRIVRDFGPNVEILHRGHRYAIVWPSVHPDTGQMYLWYRPNGEPATDPPKVRELAELPMAWWEFLTRPEPDAYTEGPDVPTAPATVTDPFITASETDATVRTAKSAADANALVGEARGRFLALTGEGNGRTQKLNNLALMYGHGVPEFWTEEQAREQLLADARTVGYVDAHGERSALVQIDNGLRDGTRLERWQRTPERMQVEMVRPEPRNTGRIRAAMLARSAVATLPDPVPLIENVLYRDSVTVLAGKFGTYKSFVAVAWAACIATGTPWEGHAVPEALPVMYVAAEGAHGIRRRLDAWERAHCPIPDTFTLVPVSVRLNSPDDMRELGELCQEMGIKVVVFDTLHMATPGVDENDAGEMGAAMDELRELHQAFGVATILPHHTGHGGGRARGTSAIEDDADTTFVIALEGEERGPENVRTLKHRKSKDSALLADRALRLELVGGTGSGYVRTTDAYEEEAAKHKRVQETDSTAIAEPVAAWIVRAAGDSMLRAQMLQVVHEVGQGVGLTMAEARTHVALRWYGGRVSSRTVKGPGVLSRSAFGKGWNAFEDAASRPGGGEPVFRSAGGQRWAINETFIDETPESLS